MCIFPIQPNQMCVLCVFTFEAVSFFSSLHFAFCYWFLCSTYSCFHLEFQKTKRKPICNMVERFNDRGRVEDVSLSNLTPGTTQATQDKSISKFFVNVMFRLLAYICTAQVGRVFVKNSRDWATENKWRSNLTGSSSREQNVSLSKREDLLQCSHRLQHLEKVVTELLNKPTEIPPEKELMLLDSMNRIKSIEHDLQKTKEALFATASQQVKLTESLELLKENALKGKESCWPLVHPLYRN
nr:phosphatidylinositol/phosphatidylcholine transfer protein SFH9 [Ipomoea batatas]